MVMCDVGLSLAGLAIDPFPALTTTLSLVIGPVIALIWGPEILAGRRSLIFNHAAISPSTH